jgi:branched-chain amino acid transport system permease protein
MTARVEFLLGIVFAVLVIGVTLAFGDKALLDVLMRLSIFGLLALSLNILVGYTGLVSFGHAMFFGLGSYAFGLLMQSGAVSIPMAALLTLLAACAWGGVVGMFCIRLDDIYFSFLTLAFQMLLYSIIIGWVSLTGGDQGLMGGIPRPPFLGINLAEPRELFVLTIIVFTVCVLVIRQIVQSPFGFALRMIRDNAERARFLGLPVQRYKLIAFVLSGFFGSVSGVLMSLYVSGAYPNFAFWSTSGDAIFMIILGGLTVFLGPLVGAIVFLLLNDNITRMTEHHGIVMGVVLLVIVLGMRKGFLDLLDEWWQARKVRAEAPAGAGGGQ